jgi:hypothetical protein
MPSKREQVLEAVLALLKTGLTGVDVQRNRDKAQKVSTGGDVIIRDGDPGDPEVSLSPQTFFYDHEIVVEVAYKADDREGGLDALLCRIGDLVSGNRTLGGLTDWLEATAPKIDVVDTNGATGARWADFTITASYLTTDPLN